MNNQTNLKPSNVYLITAVASLGGLLFGYDTAVISGAVGGLRSYFVSPLSENINIATEAIVEFKGLITICTLVIFALFSSFIFKFFKKVTAIGIMVVSILLIGSLLYSNFLSDSNELSENLGNSILGFMVSSALVGCIIGAAVGDRIANSIGRRNGLIVAALLFIISALGSAYPEKLPFLMAGNLTTFIIYRIIGGIGVGLASMLAPLYIAEMAPANMRGKLVSCNQLAIVSGMLVVYFVNYFIIKGQADDWINNIGWRYMFLSECIPAILFFFFLLIVPKTPRFQVLKGNEDAAIAVLTKYNGSSRASEILEDIKKSFKTKKAPWLSYGWAIIIIGLLLSVFQQFVGINVVLYYAPEIFKGMGMETDASMMQTIIVGAINLLFTVVAMFTVDKFGRKILMIIGSIFMAISMLGLGTVLYADSSGIVALLLMLLYIAAFAISWGPVTWVLLSEIFPNKIKGVMAVAVAVQWLANLVVSWTFPMMNNNSHLNELFNHGFAYWIYGIMAVLSAFFIWKFVPETKGKTLEEMESIWEAEGTLESKIN
ncbi:MFS transporter, sugar porter family [Galbibacter orientalis DSM 19592]|uniref:MFS transporter, sugar porter family n=1 Tax=Galbibacter orientalis DSM 19592 TaxID=926559 RepID=I3C8M3_9FLAO|nr:D-xylose transporter XylE [Galbibacter orientalis]EIJ39966.1 MFS transporter, sugar porter family [Galbibacter orientalis DSM 19592]